MAGVFGISETGQKSLKIFRENRKKVSQNSVGVFFRVRGNRQKAHDFEKSANF
jgi:hypothetical protein